MTNNQRPLSRYQRKVSPQEMINSPTICQYFIQQALLPTHKKCPSCLICPYMDDILPDALTQTLLFTIYKHLQLSTEEHGLQIAPEKVQMQEP